MVGPTLCFNGFDCVYSSNVNYKVTQTNKKAVIVCRCVCFKFAVMLLKKKWHQLLVFTNKMTTIGHTTMKACHCWLAAALRQRDNQSQDTWGLKPRLRFHHVGLRIPLWLNSYRRTNPISSTNLHFKFIRFVFPGSSTILQVDTIVIQVSTWFI